MISLLTNSKSLSEIPDVECDNAITIGCSDECPLVRANYREEWDIPDPRDMNEDEFRQVRNLIEEKVISLIHKLRK